MVSGPVHVETMAALAFRKLRRATGKPRSPLPCRSVQRFDRERDALAPANAQSDQTALEAVPAHRVDELRGQHRAGRPDRVAMSDGAAIDIDDLIGQSELARDDDGDRR